MLRGNAIVPVVAADVYAKLTALVPPDAPKVSRSGDSARETESRSTNSPPDRGKDIPTRFWDKVSVGDIALGYKRGVQGWWPVIVLAALQGDRLRVRWRDDDSEPPFTIRRYMIAFMHPSVR